MLFCKEISDSKIPTNPQKCLVIVVWLFLALPPVCLQFVIVVFPGHTHLLFFIINTLIEKANKIVSDQTALRAH